MKHKAETTRDNQTRTSQIPDTKKSGKKVAVDAQDIISLILRDHEPLKALIQILKDAEVERYEKEDSYEEFVLLLMSHAKAEEKTLYVQMKDTEELRVEGFGGDTEHAIAEQLLQEINGTPDDDEWTAKVKVLAESVEHHIEEEEEQMLVHFEAEVEAGVRIELGAEYTRLKTEIDSLLVRRASSKSKIFENRVN
ncbi:MAG: hemerythrin domain-containing protein [Bdellovibrionota bacterium]